MRGFSVTRDEASAPFYDGTASDRLLIRRCPQCGTFHPPQARRCVDSDELEWAQALGTGVLISWAVDHGPPLDAVLAAADGRTSAYGIVELDEGPWMQVPLVGVDPDSLSEGMAMRVTFVRPGDGEAIPAFTPVG
jgi:uncharacterized OB-fold protein